MLIGSLISLEGCSTVDQSGRSTPSILDPLPPAQVACPSYSLVRNGSSRITNPSLGSLAEKHAENFQIVTSCSSFLRSRHADKCKPIDFLATSPVTKPAPSSSSLNTKKKKKNHEKSFSRTSQNPQHHHPLDHLLDPCYLAFQ